MVNFIGEGGGFIEDKIGTLRGQKKSRFPNGHTNHISTQKSAGKAISDDLV